MSAQLVDLGPCRGLQITVDESRWALVLPGALGTALAAPTSYAYAALHAEGWSGILVLDQFSGDDRLGWATARYEAATAAVPEDARRVVVTKSLTSELAPRVAAEAQAAIWLTPLLQDPEVARGIAENRAPQLIVAGTDDEVHDAQVARQLDAELLELEGADHSLGIAGRPLESLDLLRTMVERVAVFARRL